MKKVRIELDGQAYTTDLDQPIDISIPIMRSGSPNAFHLPDPKFETVKSGGFVGSIQEGGSCNVENIFLSPHGNGTHTECIGHISERHEYISQCIKNFFTKASLISIPVKNEGDSYILDPDLLHSAVQKLPVSTESLIIRSLPNSVDKKLRQHSGNNPPYIHEENMRLISSMDLIHLLIDLPSLDKEDDEHLTNHKIFFQYPKNSKIFRTVTEMIFIPEIVKDGYYLLELQLLNIDSDASPSRPVLYKLMD